MVLLVRIHHYYSKLPVSPLNYGTSLFDREIVYAKEPIRNENDSGRRRMLNSSYQFNSHPKRTHATRK